MGDHGLDDPGSHTRPGEDERHGQRCVVGEEPMRPLAVIAERLAVIGGDDNQRALENGGRAQPIDEPAEHRIGIGDLAVVRLAALSVGRRRHVGRMRIEQMHPGQPW